MAADAPTLVSDSLAEARAMSYYAGAFKRDNTKNGLYAAVDSYLHGGARPASSLFDANHFAKHLVLEEDARRILVAATQPPPVPIPSSWPPTGPDVYVASDWSQGVKAPWQIAGNASDVEIIDCPWRPGEKAVVLTAGSGAAPPGGDPTTGSALSTLTAVYCPQASGVSHAYPGQETWERIEMMYPLGSMFSAGDWNDNAEHHPTFTGAFGNIMRITSDPQLGESASTSLLPGLSPRFSFGVRGGVKGGQLNVPGGEYRRYNDMPPNSLVLGRKIDTLTHWRWGDSLDDNPIAEFYIDGQLVWSTATPNLYTADPRENFGLYNYLRNVPWRLKIIYGRVAVGRTLASVGGLALAA